MREMAREFVRGAAAIILAPAGLMPEPGYCITVPIGTNTDAIAGDFGRIAADFVRGINKVEKLTQLELGLR